MIELALGLRAEAARAHLAEALAINPYFSPLHAPRARAALTGTRRCAMTGAVSARGLPGVLLVR